MSIRALTYLLVAAVAVPLLVVIGILIGSRYTHEREEAMADVVTIVEAAADNISRSLAASERLLAVLAAHAVVHPDHPQSCDIIPINLGETDPAWANIAIADRHGRIVCSAVPLPGGAPLDVTDTDWYPRAMAENRFVVSTPRVGRITGKLVTVLAYPLRESDGSPVGVAILPQEFAKIWPLPGLLDRPVPPTLTVVDRGGNVIVRQPESDLAGRNAAADPIVRAALAGRGGIGRTGNGAEVAFAYRSIPAADWVAIATIPTQVALSAARVDALRAAVIAVGVLSVALLLAMALIRRIVRPIAQISATARAVAEGNLDARMAAPREREFAAFADQFNTMLDLRRRSEQMLDNLLENAPDGMLLVDSDGAIRFANGRIVKMLGYTRSELERLSIEALVPDQAWQLYVAHRTEYQRAPEIQQMGSGLVLAARRKDGSELPVEISLSPITTPDGAMTCCAVRDVSQREAAERRIRKFKQMYQALSQTSQAMVVTSDRDSLLGEICRIAVEQGDLALAWIGLVDPAARIAKPAASAGPAARYVESLVISVDPASPLGQGPTARAIREGNPVILSNLPAIADPQLGRIRNMAAKFELTCCAAFPIREDGVVIGAVSFYSTEPFYFDDPEMVDLLAALARDLSFALDGLKRDTALADAEERFRQIAENSREVFWLTDVAQAQVLYASTAYEEVWGRSLDELYASPGAWMDAIHPEDRPRIHLAALTRQILGGYNEEYRIVKPDGEVRWIHDRAFPVKDASGSIYRIAGIARDVTDRKKGEKALHDGALRLELATKSGNVGLWDWDFSSNQVFYSREWKNQIGYAEHEIAGDLMEWDSRLHPDDRDRTLAALHAYIDNPHGPYSVEFRLRHKDGSYRWIHASASILFDDLGIAVRMLGTHTDVTDTKRADEALRERERALAALIDNVPGFVYRCRNEPDWPMEFISRGIEAQTGYTSADFISGAVAYGSLMHPDDRERVWDEVQRALMSENRRFRLEYRIVDRNGGEKWVLEHGSGVYDAEGRLRALEGTVLDITDRKQTEARLLQAQKMEALGALAGGIAHDFNNMLLPIVALTEFTKEDLPADSPLHSNLDTVLEAAKRASELVGQILAFSRRSDRERTAIDISEAVTSAVALVRNILPATITLIDRIEPEVGTATADMAQIQSVILNLAANAAHAMEGRVGRLTIRLNRLVDDAELLRRHDIAANRAFARLAITDTGHGMDETTVGKIFDPFFTTKPVGEGTGLGLSMVHGIITGFGGFIDVESELDVGTTFVIYLPLETVDEPEKHFAMNF